MTKTDEKRLFYRWTALKGLASMVLFFVLTLFLELLLVFSFQGFGLIDKTAWVGNFQFFTLVISPLFHLLPLIVIVVLVCSWVYLTKYTVYRPARVEAVRRQLSRRELEKRKFRAFRRFSRNLDRRLQGVKTRFQRIRGISYVYKRLRFEATVRSAVVVLMVFLTFSFLLFVVVYPNLVYYLVVGLYQGNPSFLGFVRGTTDIARGFGDAFAGVFIGMAPGFYYSLANTGAALTSSVVRLDVVGKYLFSQNVAAWASAIVALACGIYVSSGRHRRR